MNNHIVITQAKRGATKEERPGVYEDVSPLGEVFGTSKIFSRSTYKKYAWVNGAVIDASEEKDSDDVIINGYSAQGLPFMLVVDGGYRSDRETVLAFVKDALEPLITEYIQEVATGNYSQEGTLELIRAIIDSIAELNKGITITLSLGVTYEHKGKLYCAGFGYGDTGLVIQHGNGLVTQLAYNTLIQGNKPNISSDAVGYDDAKINLDTSIFNVEIQPGDELLGYTSLVRGLEEKENVADVTKSRLNVARLRPDAFQNQSLFTRLVQANNERCQVKWGKSERAVQNKAIDLEYDAKVAECERATQAKIEADREVTAHEQLPRESDWQAKYVIFCQAQRNAMDECKRLGREREAIESQLDKLGQTGDDCMIGSIFVPTLPSNIRAFAVKSLLGKDLSDPEVKAELVGMNLNENFFQAVKQLQEHLKKADPEVKVKAKTFLNHVDAIVKKDSSQQNIERLCLHIDAVNNAIADPNENNLKALRFSAQSAQGHAKPWMKILGILMVGVAVALAITFPGIGWIAGGALGAAGIGFFAGSFARGEAKAMLNLADTLEMKKGIVR